MAWRIVQQPNGKYARFSEIVDDFTDYDLSIDDALLCCLQYGCTQGEAANKVQRAIFAGRDRFREAMSIVARVHGRASMRRRCKQLSGTKEDYPPVRRFV